jgi:hypothetical protein
MEDVARPHKANVVLISSIKPLDSVSYHLLQCHNCANIWPPHSHDTKPCTLMELRASIIQLCCRVSEDVLQGGYKYAHSS